MNTPRSTQQDTNFRVIIVGGGVVGLTASHCLQKAGIQHVVLERRKEIAPAEGSSIAIYPHGARILHQIGCLRAAEQACTPFTRWRSQQPSGEVVMETGFFDYMRENHGKDMLCLERRRLLQILYDGLPDKTPIRTGCSVKSVNQFDNGVEVMLEDGSVETGDIVLACDGVTSLIRRLMWQHAEKTSPGLITPEEKTSFKTNWKALVGTGPAAPELGVSDFTVIHNTSYSLLIMTQPDRVFWFVFFRLPETLEWPNRGKYTKQDEEDLAARVADHPVSKSMVFGDLWKQRERGFLVPMEEGVHGVWHHERIVLAGDSAHKLTINMALGGNSGMESIVVLCNHLQQMMVAQKGVKPSQDTLTKVFTAYQAERHARIKEVLDFSGRISKVQAWHNMMFKFISLWVMPYLPERGVADYLGKYISAAPKINFVGLTGFPKARLSWKYAEEVKEVKEKDVDASKDGWVSYVANRLWRLW